MIPKEVKDAQNEEKLMAEEGIRTTSNNLISIGMPIAYDDEEDPWDSLNDPKEEKIIQDVETKIDNEVNEEYLK